MSILKYKYKAHKFINYAFYLVVFIVGFLLGFGAKKIDFNKLVSQVLMIDNVQAYNIATENGVTFNEEFIYNEFKNNFEDFDISTYKNIWCKYASNSYLNCYAMTDESYTNMNFTVSGSNISFNTGKTGAHLDYYYFHRYLGSWANRGTEYKYYNVNVDGNSSISGSCGSICSFNNAPSNLQNNTTFNKYVLLDFSGYMEVNYWLNDGSIFKDESHQDFKEACWENFDELMFSVTISSDKEYDVTYHEGQQEGETYIDSGFYVFDDVRKLKRGTRIKTLLQPDYKHDSSTWVSGVTFEHLHNITSEFYLMNKEELLESRYFDSVNALGNYDISRGDSYYYDNLSKLLNATYVGFTYYKNVIDDYRYDIFYLQEEKEKFCIYIPNDFIVTTLSINELGGIYGDVPTHTDKSDTYIDMESVHNNNFSYNSLFSVIKEFIASIRETVNLINGYIYSLFISLPPLAQMFIISIITLIVVKTIIWMVVK